MGVQRVHGGVEGEGGVVLPDGLHALHKGLAPTALEVGENGGAEGIVHQSVAVAPQNVLAAHAVGHLGGPVLPYLADDHRVGLLRPGGLVNAVDKAVRQLVGHVQPPAVRPCPQPPADHAVLPAEDELLVGGVVFIDGGQSVNPPPALVPAGPLGEVEPGAVRGVLALLCPRLRVEAVAVEVAAHIAGVVEHPVQHHPHTPPVSLGAQAGEVLVGAQHGVHTAVIGGAVAVVLRRLKDGVEVEGLHAQLLQIVQPVDHALKVPAKEVPVAHLAPVVGAELGKFLPALMDPPTPHHALRIGNPAAAEAVGENLIGGALSKPGGDFFLSVVDGELVGTQVLLGAVQLFQLEGIPDQSHISRGVQLRREQVLAQVVALPGHFHDDGLVVAALKARGQAGVGIALCPGRAEGKPHLRPGSRRPEGRLIPEVPGVVCGSVVQLASLRVKVLSGIDSSRRR